MVPSRSLVAALYLAAGLLVLAGPLQSIVTAWPIRAGDVAWRFGFIGVLTRALLPAVLGLVLATSTAWLLGHRRTLRTLAVAHVGIALGLWALLALFVLDALTLRRSIQAQLRSGYDIASLQALALLGVAAAIALLLGIAAWNGGRRVKQDAGSRLRNASTPTAQYV